jgi:DNA-binding response OmpR family regulator
MKTLLLFITSMPEQVDRTEALGLGADDYIVKPFEPDALLKMIQCRISSESNRQL